MRWSYFTLTIGIILSAVCVPPALSALSSQQASANEQTSVPGNCILQGIVRDSEKHPVPGATVFLSQDQRTLKAETDATGAYRFSSIPQGPYSIHAEMAGYANSAVTQVLLGHAQAEKIDLTLDAAKAAAAQNSPTQPQFFDEPHFTVAGVTDTTTVGGHGSSRANVSNTESLVKETASLSDASNGRSTAPSTLPIEQSLRQAVVGEPASFEANYQLGKCLVDEGKAGEGIAYLETANGIKPGDRDGLYELALARFESGDYSRARTELLSLTKTENGTQAQSQTHHLLAEVDEKIGDSLQAVREYQRAADLNPSETNLFDWGSELLLHHAAQPAVQVFTEGNRLFPRSVRMLAALGSSWYALGFPEDAAQRLCDASDLDPSDPNPYLFMGKMLATEAIPSAGISKRLARFAQLEPENALANYYDAVSIWKSRKSDDRVLDLPEVESLLTKSLQLDPKLALAHLQLGIIYAERKETARGITAYQRAIAADPDLEEAHYRLAQAYRQVGDSSKAQAELQSYEKISKENAEETERQRREVKQFVYELGGQRGSEPR